ncbi:MAG: mechanosensitive ion channel family protein [Arcobacteraceae bacterium]|jgi:small-conductance mechanosensitive channel|nr:mechanosensitive ion channel family protein [Arcobacteraceae bacterium]
MKFARFILVFTFLFQSLYGVDTTQNTINKNNEITKLVKSIQSINENLKANLLIKRYNNYLAYRDIEKELEQTKIDAQKYSAWEGVKYKELSYQLTNKIKIKQNELSLIDEYKDSPIGKTIKPKEIASMPAISNPFNIIEAYSFIQILDKNVKTYKETNTDVNDLVKILLEEMGIYKQILELDPHNPIVEDMVLSQKRLNDFTMVADIVSTTSEVYSRKVDQLKQETNDKITNEIHRTVKLSLIILVLIGLSIGIKLALKKYVKDDDSLYTSNKLINFLLIFLIIIIIVFSYIENAAYLVTVLGFASAGIAIALKDWFMSIFGWFVIMASGAVRVGDRIKVNRDNSEMVGDVLDISLFKMTVREDVTLTTYRKTRRSGRVFFVPNNYIFTDLIANYTYDGLRTVWDGIDITITFDSNHQKAVEIANEITTKHSKGFTELTKKRMSKLKSRYVLRSTNPEPRIFTFIEPYGIVVSAWYYTNSYATLGLRSKISMEILDAFLKQDDIQVAYPTQTLRVTNSQVGAENLLPGGTANGLFDGPSI